MSDLKPIHLLSADDIRRYPVWTYATDAEEDHDETYVQPFIGSEVPTAEDYAVYHVACDIVTASGARHVGFVSVCNGQQDGEAPTAVGVAGEYWPFDELPARRSQARFEAAFGAPFEAIFPVAWTLRVLVEGEKRHRVGTYAF